ncbi:23S rRNA (guanosine(2251)-2'-O)-methyltransferase RlmB [Prochlorococcus marinus]|uniref:23S rRNA (Guanosine-2'-O-)-methyltransferase rlmB LSU rRNA Gm2251 n=1 Tax=Prochlorococcus marinus str. GP2 TaxID=59925 RepID=A0A0A1ZI03_PROMR|nr:23S rRNA (guanosine(2251)-2'-O)-methyltransferase RlmB [Prochlorococcus marinus]KGF87849.1 23S rRNA (guanosine-2'-O-) -methyltransferase rlmB LSU rRNA Gm2251 [Prochlorococcus marinus str. GP2]
MKNSSKNNNSKNNIKQNKKSFNSNFFPKNTSTSKNNQFFSNVSKNRGNANFDEGEKKNSNFSSFKTRKPFNKSNIEVSRNTRDIYQEQANKKNFDDWIWGKHSVFETLVSKRAINRIWCTSEIFSSEKFYILLKDLKSKGVLIEEVSWNRLSQLTLGATHQGIALQLACSKTVSLEKLINSSKNKSANPIILALDGITDPHNVGAIIRSAEAFNCKGIIIPQRRSAGLTGTVAKVAAGAIEHLPVCRVVNLNRALDEMKKNGFLVIGLSGDGQLSISNFHEKTPLVVIVGAEDKGISLLTQKKCDFLLKIPLKGKTTSLNASVAAAISLFHLTSK